MLRFEPSRSSTPPRARLASSHPSNATLTSTASSTLPLSALTEEHIDVIDDIISRTPHATTFLAVFNAYKAVLQERGINEEDDVVYYGFLLKLGVVKGKDWETRWNTVKDDVRGSANRSGIRDAWDTSGFPDHSHEYEDLESNTDHAQDTPRHILGGAYKRHPVSARFSRGSASGIMSHGIDKFKTPVATSLKGAKGPSFPGHLSSPPSDGEDSYAEPKRRTWAGSEDDTEPDDDNDYNRDPIAPSYQTSATSVPLSTPNPAPKRASLPTLNHGSRTSMSKQPPDPPQSKFVLPSKQERGVNGHDFWDVENMERDADDFYEEMLTRRYWDIWRSGVEWVFTTSRQVYLAKNTILLRTYLDKWKIAATQRQNLEQRVMHVDAVRRLRSAFRKWMQSIEEKRKREIREGIRRRYSLVKHAIDGRILRQFFKRMLLSSRLSRMERLSDKLAIYNAFRIWRGELHYVKDMLTHVLPFERRRDKLSLLRCLCTWRRRADLIIRERTVMRTTDRRRLGSCWDIWLQAASLSTRAKWLERKQVLKSSFAVWRNHCNRVKALNKKADTACHRRDLLLLLIVWRLWVAREKGVMFERIQHSRLSRAVLQTWQNKLHHQRMLNYSAINFAHNKAVVMHQRAFASWRDRASRARAAEVTAEMFYSRNLLARAFRGWQKRRKKEDHQFRNARLARRWFIKRDYWRRWLIAMDGRVLQRKLGYWKLAKTRDYFEVWRTHTVRRRKHEALAEHVQRHQIKRILAKALGIWQFRTIEIHDQELQVTRLFDARLLKVTFSKWARAHSRHQDRLALMHSFQDIKHDELLRKAFIFWNQSTHHSVRRRERLRRREERTRQALLSGYLGRWYDAYKELQLRDAEDEMVRRGYTNTMRTKLQKWKAKTPTMPAIHFEASRTRSKAWGKWRSALPRARVLKVALQTERQNVLARMFRRWLATYRAKMNMKAIARARYLRLPSSTPPVQPRAHRPRSPFSHTTAITPTVVPATSTKTSLLKPHTARPRHSTSPFTSTTTATGASASAPRPPLLSASAALVNRSRDVRASSASPAALRPSPSSAFMRLRIAPTLPPVRRATAAVTRPTRNPIGAVPKDEDATSVASSSSFLARPAPFVPSRRAKIVSAPPSTVAHPEETSSAPGSLAANTGTGSGMQARRRRYPVPGASEGGGDDDGASTIASDAVRRVVRRPQQPPRPASANAEPVSYRKVLFSEREGLAPTVGRPRRGSFLGAI